MIYLFIEKTTSRVVFFSNHDVTFLQSMEGTFIDMIQHDESLNEFLRLSDCVNWKFCDGQLLSAPTPNSLSILIHQQCLALQKVHEFVNKARRQYLKHDLVGQEFVYQKKYDDAVKFLASGGSSNDLTAYPFLAVEVSVTKRSARIVALEIQRTFTEAQFTLLASEKARRYFTDRICSATTIEELKTVLPLIIGGSFKIPIEVN